MLQIWLELFSVSGFKADGDATKNDSARESHSDSELLEHLFGWRCLER